MKQVRNTFVWITLFSLCGIFPLSTLSQSYQDDFDVLKEKSWKHWGEYAIWRVEDGFLKGWIQSPPAGGEPWPTIELLQFNDPNGSDVDFEINDQEFIQRRVKIPGYENITITVKNIAQKQSFGIALGRRLPDSSKLFFYLFNTNDIYAAHLGPQAGFGIPFDTKPLQAQKQGFILDVLNRWKTLELASMEIRFNRGHFQWFADGKKREEFEDPEFPSVEIFGFFIRSDGLAVGHGRVDSFKITGPGLSVSPQAKLVTTWGQLKQHQ
ncbi:MAG: hypothetical protein OXU23_03260 [Candidatus Poribacteria bacterium]|nr:hypothetical protein [Candidatus Poribacteria bacterium]